MYIPLLQNFFRLLAVCVLPCLLLKTAHEVTRVIYVHYDSWWKSVLALLALLVSWTFSTIIFLSGSALFNLVCSLQVIHFENYGKLLERDMDVSAYIEEHTRLTRYLSKISHRFRIYLILQILVVTVSQFVALLQTTGNHGIVNLINGGDFAVSSEQYASCFTWISKRLNYFFGHTSIFNLARSNFCYPLPHSEI